MHKISVRRMGTEFIPLSPTFARSQAHNTQTIDHNHIDPHGSEKTEAKSMSPAFDLRALHEHNDPYLG